MIGGAQGWGEGWKERPAIERGLPQILRTVSQTIEGALNAKPTAFSAPWAIIEQLEDAAGESRSVLDKSGAIKTPLRRRGEVLA